MRPDKYLPIADYALIGDMRTAALIGTNGSLDWCCFPRFDSPAVFCKLLDADKGGEFRISPVQKYSVVRAYVDATNVLSQTYTVEGGTFRLIDFMPVASADVDSDGDTDEAVPRICRRVEGISGECEVEVIFRPTPDYARSAKTATVLGDQVQVRADGILLVLQSSVPLQVQDTQGAMTRFRIRAGEHIDFCLRLGQDTAERCDDLARFDRLLNGTLDYWRTWASQCTYRGRYQKIVQRSTLVLKLLTYAPSGAIVAAPTTSLPEEIGGSRNWDYRYTWIRDSALILHALMATGYHHEAHQFFDWVESLSIQCWSNLQIMYTITGDKELPEQLLEHLDGYHGSRPVRIGNGAATQTQLDIFGELVDAMYYCYKNMRMPHEELWPVVRGLANQAATRWREPDAGIWEVRGGPRHYLYSKLQCWVALDRAIQLASAGNFGDEVNGWIVARDAIRKAILEQGYDEQLGAFVQAFDVKALDASALTIPLLGFLPADDARVRSTVTRIREQLSADGLVYRYLNEDGLPGGEATFALCTLWMVDNLVLTGQAEQARQLFEKVLEYGNDVGLFAEEFVPGSGELLGNFPQGFTHLALIRSAINLDQAEKLR